MTGHDDKAFAGGLVRQPQPLLHSAEEEKSIGGQLRAVKCFGGSPPELPKEICGDVACFGERSIAELFRQMDAQAIDLCSAQETTPQYVPRQLAQPA